MNELSGHTRPLSFGEKERRCERHFYEIHNKYGQLWHISTPGNLSETLFVEDEDFKFAVSNSAISAAESGLVIFTDQIMGNHIHTLGGGTKEQCIDYLDRFTYRLVKYSTRQRRFLNLKNFRCDDPIEITSLDMMRNEIVYINRNGYLVKPSCTPFSYPWGSGSVYFNLLLHTDPGIPFKKIPFRDKRFLCCRRNLEMPHHYRYGRSMILPDSYSLYRDGEEMFRDAHQYFYLLTRNYESYSEESKRLGDTILLTDEEIYPVAKMLSWRDYKVEQPSLLPVDAKKAIARILHTDYHATPNQIRRVLGLAIEIVRQLFPPHP
ncbi:MAG: hypothetical protein IKX34_02670 [Bacteroidales bacterium]|nr:hypothetical protein [Bacteroidales bacterium]